jgi:hypothetical protein
MKGFAEWAVARDSLSRAFLLEFRVRLANSDSHPALPSMFLRIHGGVSGGEQAIPRGSVGWIKGDADAR